MKRLAPLFALLLLVSPAAAQTVAEDPDDGVWLQRRDAARAEAALAAEAELRRQIDSLRRELESRRRIDALQHRLLELSAQEVAAECRQRVRAEQEAGHWRRRLVDADRERVRSSRADRALAGASAGFGIGSLVAPGIGTLIGAAAGAAIGFFSVAGAVDPPTTGADSPVDPVAACPPPPVPAPEKE